MFVFVRCSDKKDRSEKKRRRLEKHAAADAAAAADLEFEDEPAAATAATAAAVSPYFAAGSVASGSPNRGAASLTSPQMVADALQRHADAEDADEMTAAGEDTKAERERLRQLLASTHQQEQEQAIVLFTRIFHGAGAAGGLPQPSAASAEGQAPALAATDDRDLNTVLDYQCSKAVEMLVDAIDSGHLQLQLALKALDCVRQKVHLISTKRCVFLLYVKLIPMWDTPQSGEKAPHALAVSGITCSPSQSVTLLPLLFARCMSAPMVDTSAVMSLSASSLISSAEFKSSLVAELIKCAWREECIEPILAALPDLNLTPRQTHSIIKHVTDKSDDTG